MKNVLVASVGSNRVNFGRLNDVRFHSYGFVKELILSMYESAGLSGFDEYGYDLGRPITIVVGPVLQQLLDDQKPNAKLLYENHLAALEADTSKDVTFGELAELALYKSGIGVDALEIGDGTLRSVARPYSIAGKIAIGLNQKRTGEISKLKADRAEVIKKMTPAEIADTEDKYQTKLDNLSNWFDILAEPVGKLNCDLAEMYVARLVEAFQTLTIPSVEKSYNTVTELVVDSALQNHKDVSAKLQTDTDRMNTGRFLSDNNASLRDIKRALNPGAGEVINRMVRLENLISEYNTSHGFEITDAGYLPSVWDAVIDGKSKDKDYILEEWEVKFTTLLQYRTEFTMFVYGCNPEIFRDEIKSWNKDSNHSKKQIVGVCCGPVESIFPRLKAEIERRKNEKVKAFTMSDDQRTKFLNKIEAIKPSLKPMFRTLLTDNNEEGFFAEMQKYDFVLRPSAPIEPVHVPTVQSETVETEPKAKPKAKPRAKAKS